MRTNYLTSLEGWNFDKLQRFVHRWNRVGQQNFYISEGFMRKGVFIQLLKSYDRVVGVLEREHGAIPMVIRLGNWGQTSTSQITKFANKNNYMVIDVSLFSPESIDYLQEGLRS